MAEVWAPSLVEVAGCIPTRTSNVNLPGESEYMNNFTKDTRPTDEQAQRVIDHAVSDVVSSWTITAELQDVAKNAAMWRAAADIELAYPERNADVNYFLQLDARARYEWERLSEAAGKGEQSTSSGIPQWAMPEPVWYGDRQDI